MDLYEGLKEYLEKLEKSGFFEDEIERIHTIEALGRITGLPVYANRNVPHYTSAAMDGIALKSSSSFGASESSPKILEKRKDFIFVNTGDPIPKDYDSVLMIEKVRIIDDDRVMIFEPVFPTNDLRPIGEDVTAGEMIVTRYHKIEHYDIPLFLAAGVFELDVLKRIKAVVIPTGDEIVDPREARLSGRIPETNSSMVRAFLKEMNVESDVTKVVPDIPEEIEKSINNAIEKYDIIFTIAGSSAGSKDFTYRVLEKNGEIVVHGMNIKPGKPVILAIVNGKPVIGLPGFPVSLDVVLQKVVKPVILKKYKTYEKTTGKKRAVSSIRMRSSISEEEYIRGVLANVENRTVFSPLKRGAANLISLTRHDSVLTVEKGKVVVDEGEEVEVEYFGGNLEKKILVVGSHDLLIDVLADLLKLQDHEIVLSSSSVGSMGGIIAISKGYAHMAGTHLFDPNRGEYNISYIEKFMKDYVLINMSYRIQGLMVRKGNPKNIKGLSDLIRDDINFVNRQKASGTRVLLDYLLDKENIDKSKINGYDVEEISHMNVAVKVKEGLADVGMGIESAARIMDLDFIPIVKERYDLLINKNFAKTPMFEKILKVLKSEEFKREAKRIGGYDLSDSGKVIHE